MNTVKIIFVLSVVASAAAIGTHYYDGMRAPQEASVPAMQLPASLTVEVVPDHSREDADAARWKHDFEVTKARLKAEGLLD